ncbi:Oidioi.mRNA.OKI2018_I69.PAR.g10831.t1.cds [Oikopleura dioica]|uniref:Oidioi.mRNA.OKI2018_I69.PAR.g10831.t1.cds n=1 Tax=Oikopleura dioica TaxID=34765 RepID=A0ABN7RX33_OIKDI|nr:Oidioi.mRNA.OKI2018_I69.PAR.g10831.t1.cds [Oikopleura dioica]
MKLSGLLIPLANPCSAFPSGNPLFAEVEAVKQRVTDISSYLLSNTDFSKNIAVSPVNIFSAIKVLQKSTSGPAREELEEAFGNEDAQRFENQITKYAGDLYELGMANKIFYRPINGSEPSTEIGQISETFDFKNPLQNPSKINDFIDEQTKGKIPQAFPKPIDPDTFFLLISTLYFKASWTSSFSPTTICWKMNEGPCEERDGFVGTDHFNMFYDWDAKKPFRVLDLPLALLKDDDRFAPDQKTFSALQIWMPDKVLQTESDHKEFLELMNRESQSVVKKMRLGRARLFMPKFSISTELELKTMLYDKNCTSIMNPGQHLEPIYGDNDPTTSLNEAKHIVQFDVDENGVEGAAVTAFSMMYRSFPMPVKIDRPFYFRLILKTEDANLPEYGAPIFSGRVVNP